MAILHYSGFEGVLTYTNHKTTNNSRFDHDKKQLFAGLLPRVIIITLCCVPLGFVSSAVVICSSV